MKRSRLARLALSSVAIVTSMVATVALAGPKEQCYRMHNRIVGIPPTQADMDACVAKVSAGQAEAAAMAMLEHNYFYSDTLVSMFTPFTNENLEVLQPYNDMTISMIGLVRDDADFRTVLYDDVLYTCGTAAATAVAPNNNTHYEQCKTQLTTPLKTAITKSSQNTVYPVVNAADKTKLPAGILSTRQFASAYYDAGTNRVVTRFVLNDFLCEDIDRFHDTSIADFRVRQDVDRTPGGSTKTYLNECKGCHAGMDPLTAAFAYLDFDATTMAMTYTEGKVVGKYFRNSYVYPEGFVSPDDNWANYWTKGQNARVGWGVPEGTVMKGAGPKSWGQMIAGSDQFGRCMAKHAYRKLCLKEGKLDDATIKELGDSFKNSGGKMKALFAKTMTMCLGE